MSKQATKPQTEWTKSISVPVRVRKGNNDYELHELTFAAPTSVKVLRKGLSRAEADYELRIALLNWMGPNRLGPSDGVDDGPANLRRHQQQLEERLAKPVKA